MVESAESSWGALKGARVLQITACPFPPEIRVAKEATSLAEAGCVSAVMCPPIEGKGDREVWNGISVYRPASLASSRTRTDKLLYQTSYFSPAWRRATTEVVTEFKPDVVHVHDIWLARSVFGALTTERRVIDLHENMPAAVVEYLAGYRPLFRWFNRIFKSHRRVLAYERSVLKRADLVLVVVEEARQRVVEAHVGLDPQKVVNVENLETRTFIEPSAAQPHPALSRNDSILYIGGFGPHRGLDTLVEAQSYLKSWGVDSRLYLVGGRESNYLQMLQDLVARLNVGDRVEILGWVPAEAVLGYVREAAVCAVPHHTNPHTDTTIPHKLYQYMIAGRPVLVSSSPPLARTVTQADAGLVFEAGNARDCALKIQQLLADPDAADAMAARGRSYVLELGNSWEETSGPALLSAYTGLLSGNRTRAPQ